MVALTFFNELVLHGAAKRGGPILAKLWTVGWRWVGRNSAKLSSLHDFPGVPYRIRTRCCRRERAISGFGNERASVSIRPDSGRLGLSGRYDCGLSSRPYELQMFSRAIPCSNGAQQRHKIIRNGVALVGQESVSGSPAATGRGISQENPPMRIYVIDHDGITLCREPLATVTEGDIAVTSKEELQAAPLSGKRLLALWNALPGVEKRKKVGDRAALIDQLWSAIEALPDPEPKSDAKRPSSRMRSSRCCAGPRAPPSTRLRALWAGSGALCAVSSPGP